MMAIFPGNSHGSSETTTGSNSKYAVLFHSRVRALMFQHTRKRPLAPNPNSNHKREYAGFFSLFHQIRSSSKEPYKMAYKKKRRFAARVNSLQRRAAEGDDETGEHFSRAKTN